MWLLHVHTLKLEWFTDCWSVQYAILSHRWEEDEVSFSAIQSGEVAKEQKGYQKVLNAAHRTVLDKLKYVWIDTCCINKDSSAELSESINSMFQWYQAARVCYAYLSDVDLGMSDSREINLASRIVESQWFTRGWTLQELIAPRRVAFFDKSFLPICKKRDCVDAISAKTGIDEGVLKGGDFLSLSAAERMSWASNRHTTRIEDEAYSLLGLFGVNMPLLYGEGRGAFRRLQEEIIRSSDDHSILAWGLDLPDKSLLTWGFELKREDYVSPTTSLLASSPKDFAGSKNVITFRSETSTLRGPYSLTNIGLRITLPIGKLRRPRKCAFALINCRIKDEPFKQLAIPVRPVTLDDHEYLRRDARLERVLMTEQNQFEPQPIVIRTVERLAPDHSARFWLRSMPTKEQGIRLLEVFPPSAWNSDAGLWSTSLKGRARRMHTTWLGWMRFDVQDQDELLLRFGATVTWHNVGDSRYSKACVRAFTLTGSKDIGLDEIDGRLSEQRLEDSPFLSLQNPAETVETLDRMNSGSSSSSSDFPTESQNLLIENHPGVRIKSQYQSILGEETCIVDIAPRPVSLTRRLGRLVDFTFGSAQKTANQPKEQGPEVTVYSEEVESGEGTWV